MRIHMRDVSSFLDVSCSHDRRVWSHLPSKELTVHFSETIGHRFKKLVFISVIVIGNLLFQCVYNVHIISRAAWINRITVQMSATICWIRYSFGVSSKRRKKHRVPQNYSVSKFYAFQSQYTTKTTLSSQNHWSPL